METSTQAGVGFACSPAWKHPLFLGGGEGDGGDALLLVVGEDDVLEAALPEDTLGMRISNF